MILFDRYHRVIDYIRISVTDRCNLRCIYCRPTEIDFNKNILTYEEIIMIVKVGAKLGIKKVRLTGGEPLVRKNIHFLINQLKHIKGIKEINLTTNGVLLGKYAKQLKEAGLCRVNVSLDTLKHERYKNITGEDKLQNVLEGIEKAYQLGLKPIKLNVVVINGINDDEIEDFAMLTKKNEYYVRFIEFMPSKGGEWSKDKCLSTNEIKKRIEKIEPLIPVKSAKSSTANYYKFINGKGIIGFISGVTKPFCNNCNRIRITADGKILPCLFSNIEIDIKKALQKSSSEKEIERLLRLSVDIKPKGYKIKDNVVERFMSEIGG